MYGQGRPAQHQDLPLRLHHRGLSQAPRRLGRRTPRLGAILSRRGTLGAAGKTGGDPEGPVVTLSLSDGPGIQWAAAPLNQPGLITNWSHELERDRWWHVAVVNDGTHTTMYVDGCQVARNPATRTTGIAALGLPWLLGAYEYGGTLDQLMHGWLGDIRIIERALPVRDFMNA